MASSIILYVGNSVKQETDYYPANIIPFAFLSEESSGILATNNEDINIRQQETNYRGVLAAIRGALLVQELSYINAEIINSCFCACINKPNEEQRNSAAIVKSIVAPIRAKDAAIFVPNNIEQILVNLVDRDILFDGDEINFEIKRGTIKKSKDLDDILLQNKTNTLDVDMDEYGWSLNLREMKNDMDLDLGEHAVVRPFLDAYLANCNHKNMKLAEYAASNVLGFCILSKFKENPKLDFEFIVNFRSDYTGPVEDISMDVGVSPIIKFRKSSEKVKMDFYSKEILEKCYGKELKLNVMHKLPFIFRNYDASIYTEGLDVITKVRDLELAGIVHPVFGSVRQKMRYIGSYGAVDIN